MGGGPRPFHLSQLERETVAIVAMSQAMTVQQSWASLLLRLCFLCVAPIPAVPRVATDYALTRHIRQTAKASFHTYRSEAQASTTRCFLYSHGTESHLKL